SYPAMADRQNPSEKAESAAAGRGTHLDGRVTTLEERYAHLERSFAELNEVVIDQQRRIERLEAILQIMHDRVDRLDPTIDPPRDAAEERPPHYRGLPVATPRRKDLPPSAFAGPSFCAAQSSCSYRLV